MNDLTVTTRQHAECRSVIAVGEIDLASCPALEDATLGMVLDSRMLHLEMSGVSFMDSAGLNLLLRLRRLLLSEGGRLLVTGMQTQPLSVLRLTGTDTLLLPDTATAP